MTLTHPLCRMVTGAAQLRPHLNPTIGGIQHRTLRCLDALEEEEQELKRKIVCLEGAQSVEATAMRQGELELACYELRKLRRMMQ